MNLYFEKTKTVYFFLIRNGMKQSVTVYLHALRVSINES